MPDNGKQSTDHAVPASRSTRGSGAIRLVIVALFVAMSGGLFWLYGDQLNLTALARHEADFRNAQIEHPWLVYGICFVAYVTVTGLSLPGAAAMTLLLGWLLGFWRALLIVSFASTTGASIAFLLSRYLLRDAIESRYGSRLTSLNEALRLEGAFYLFTLRLIPAVPFFVINVLMGLTSMRLLTFWWVSQVGMLPGTAAYVYAGASVPSLSVLAEHGASGIISPQLLAAFVILGLLPITLRKLLTKFRPPTATSESNTNLE
ncbi:MAG: TVP38/TMEM64 family protein [Planctomycetaceae bacterium]|nr:TVP38/TMEM64 family protein [Planctomycetaceae bacterium]